MKNVEFENLVMALRIKRPYFDQSFSPVIIIWKDRSDFYNVYFLFIKYRSTFIEE